MTVLAAVLLISSSPADGVAMTFLDVGQGDCIWIGSARESTSWWTEGAHLKGRPERIRSSRT